MPLPWCLRNLRPNFLALLLVAAESAMVAESNGEWLTRLVLKNQASFAARPLASWSKES